MLLEISILLNCWLAISTHILFTKKEFVVLSWGSLLNECSYENDALSLLPLAFYTLTTTHIRVVNDGDDDVAVQVEHKQVFRKIPAHKLRGSKSYVQRGSFVRSSVRPAVCPRSSRVWERFKDTLT